jgi:tetratricopeptide (TPR) repeat protein
MSTFTAVWLAATVLGWAGEPASGPDLCKATDDAAWKALEEGRGDEAEAMLRMLVTQTEASGQDDLPVAKPLECLALMILARSTKRYDEAKPLLDRALAIREKTQGPDHKDVAATLLTMVEANQIQGGFFDRESTAKLKRAGMIVKNWIPTDDELNGRLLHISAFIMMAGRQYETAEKSLQTALKYNERAFGPKSKEVATIIDDMGDLHAVQGFLSRPLLARLILGYGKGEKARHHGKLAIENYARALAIREAVYPPGHVKIADSLFNLGQIHLVLGELDEADSYLTRWLTLDNVSPTPSDKYRERVFIMLAESARKRGDREAARDWETALHEHRTAMNARKTADSAVERAGTTVPTGPRPADSPSPDR